MKRNKETKETRPISEVYHLEREFLGRNPKNILQKIKAAIKKIKKNNS